jgi:hypothetical protein
MDEADGRPGYVALQFGHPDAPSGRPKSFCASYPSLNRKFFKRLKPFSIRFSVFPGIPISYQTTSHTSGGYSQANSMWSKLKEKQYENVPGK